LSVEGQPSIWGYRHEQRKSNKWRESVDDIRLKTDNTRKEKTIARVSPVTGKCITQEADNCIRDVPAAEIDPLRLIRCAYQPRHLALQGRERQVI
jgi:hypothetical protein